MTTYPELLGKFLKDERRCEEIIHILDNFNFKPTHFLRELTDQHLKNLRRKRRTWLQIYESEHPYNMNFLESRPCH